MPTNWLNLNTSNVNVNLSVSHNVYKLVTHLNTSNVNVNLPFFYFYI